MQLNRQQLGSENWGSSVNTNGGKIEQETNRLQGEINKLAAILEEDFGVLFGGFLRFDVTNEAETISGDDSELSRAKYSSQTIGEGIKANKIICISQSVSRAKAVSKPADISDDASTADQEKYQKALNEYNIYLASIIAEGRKFYDIGEATTVPLNRVFRIVGDGTIKNTETNPVQEEYANAINNPYLTAWTANNTCVYSGNGYRDLFWNDYMWKPSYIDAEGKLVGEYSQPEQGEDAYGAISTSFPGNMVDAVSYKYNISSFQEVSVTENGKTLTYLTHDIPYDITKLGMSTDDKAESSDYFFATDVNFYSADGERLMAFGKIVCGANNTVALRLNKSDFTDYTISTDYVVVTYYKVITQSMPVIRMGPVKVGNGSEPLSKTNPITFTVEILEGAVKVGDQLQVCEMNTYTIAKQDIERDFSRKERQKLKSFASYTIREEDLNKRYLSITINGGTAAEGGKALKRLLSTGTKQVGGVKKHSNYHPKYLRIRRPIGVTDQKPLGYNAVFSNTVSFMVYGRYNKVKGNSQGWVDENDIEQKPTFESYGTVSIQ